MIYDMNSTSTSTTPREQTKTRRKKRTDRRPLKAAAESRETTESELKAGEGELPNTNQLASEPACWDLGGLFETRNWKHYSKDDKKKSKKKDTKQIML